MIKLSQLSIRSRTLLLGIGPALLMFILLVSIFVWQRIEDAKVDVEVVGNIVSSQLAASIEYPVISGNFELLEPLAENAITSPAVVRVNILSATHDIIYQRQIQEYPEINQSDIVVYSRTVSQARTLYSGFSEFDELSNEGEERIIIAYVQVEMSSIEGRNRAIVIGSKSMLWAALVLFLCFLLARRLSRSISAPVEKVSNLLSNIEQGEFDIKAEITDGGEIGSLQKSVNSMASALKDAEQAQRIAIEESTEARLKAEQANAAKSDFLSIVSHELRTPINGAAGALQLISQFDHAEIKQYVDIAELSLNNLLELVEDMLTLSQRDQGEQEVITEVVHLPSLLKHNLTQLKILSDKNKNELFINFDANLTNRKVAIDPRKFRQIVRHLVGNAIKFTNNGRIYCSLYLENTRDGLKLKLDVSDNGIGFPDEKKKLLFQAFQQQDTSLTRKFEGLGIGLTVCQNNVDVMEGELIVRDNIDKGTIVNCVLPATLHEGVDSKPKKYRQSSDTRVVKKIMVVEDNQVNRMVIEKILKSLNYDVTCVSTGKDCLNEIESGQYQLILMDCHMPDMDGFHTTQGIRSYEKRNGLTNTPVIALTANTSSDIRQRCLLSGMSDYMSKPVKIDKLDEMIGRWS